MTYELLTGANQLETVSKMLLLLVGTLTNLISKVELNEVVVLATC